MKTSKILINLTAVVFTVYGALFALFPATMFEFITDGGVTTSSALIDIRATYGGMSVAAGVILFMLSRKAETVRLGLISALVLMLGMATGRMIGMAVDQDANVIMTIYLALELLVVAASGYLLKTVAD